MIHFSVPSPTNADAGILAGFTDRELTYLQENSVAVLYFPKLDHTLVIAHDVLTARRDNGQKVTVVSFFKEMVDALRKHRSLRLQQNGLDILFMNGPTDRQMVSEVRKRLGAKAIIEFDGLPPSDVPPSVN